MKKSQNSLSHFTVTTHLFICDRN